MLPKIENHEGFLVVREDLLEGGTKRRVLNKCLKSFSAEEFVYAATPYGYGQLALALACRDLGIKAKVLHFNPSGKVPLFDATQKAGAKITLIKQAQSFDEIEALAREYAEQKDGRCFLEPGLDAPLFLRELARFARGLGGQPEGSLVCGGIWCLVASITISMA